MEKLNSIIHNLIYNNHGLSVEDNFLENYFTSMQQLDFLQTVIETNNEYHEFWQNILSEYQLPIDITSPYRELNEQQINTFQKIVLSIISISTNNNAQKVNIIPLLIKFDINNQLTNYLLSINYFDGLDNIIFKMLGAIEIKPMLNNELSKLHCEHVLYESYIESQQTNTINIINIDKFIISMRSSTQSYNISLFKRICPLLYALNKEQFMKLLNDDSDFLSYLALTNPLNIANKIEVALNSKNILVKYSIVWQLDNYPVKISDDEIIDFARLIIQLSECNLSWEPFINYLFVKIIMFRDLYNLTSALGKACNELADDKIINIFEHLPISHITANNIVIKNITNLISHITILQNHQLASGILYKRWEDFIDNYKDNLNSLLITNLIDATINYMLGTKSPKEINRQIKDLTLLIDNTENIWFGTISEQQNFVYKQLSKLFVFCFVAKAMNQYDSLQELKKILIKIKFIHKDNVQEREKTTFMIFSENFFS